MHYAQPVIRRKINVEVIFILTKIRSPNATIISVKGGGYRSPVDQISRVPDQQAGHVVEAGVGEIKIVADPNGASIRMVAAHDRIAVSALHGLGEPKVCGTSGQRSGQDGSISDKAAAGNHGEKSIFA